MPRLLPTAFPTDPLVTDATALGAAIRAARTAAGLTLPDAAMTIGVSKSTLSDLERGTGTVGVGLALRIAAELGVGVLVVPSAQRESARRRLIGLLPAATLDNNPAPRAKRRKGGAKDA